MSRDPWDLLPLAAVCCVALWLRVSLLHHGYQPDELANLDEGSVWSIVWDAESAVNPPLLRATLNGLFDISTVLDRGRQLNVLLGTCAVAVGWLLGWRTGGSQLTGLLGAALLAGNPALIEMSACARAYAPWCLVACWHLYAVLGWLDAADEHRARWWRQMMVSAALLPWLHYLSGPLLLLLGSAWLLVPDRRDGFTAYVPAGVGILPMAALILTEDSTRVATYVSYREVFSPILALGQHTPPALIAALRPDGVNAAPPDLHAAMAASTLLFLGLYLARWRHLDLSRRWLLWGAISVLITVRLLSLVQFVRSPVAICLLVFVVPLVTSAVGALPHLGARLLASALACVWLLSGTAERIAEPSGARKADALRELSTVWRDFDAQRRGRPIMTAPSYTFVGMHYYLTRTHTRGRTEACGASRCYTFDGARFVQAAERAPRTPPDGLLLSVLPTPDGLAEGCTLLDQRTDWAAYDCHGPR